MLRRCLRPDARFALALAAAAKPSITVAAAALTVAAAALTVAAATVAVATAAEPEPSSAVAVATAALAVAATALAVATAAEPEPSAAVAFAAAAAADAAAAPTHALRQGELECPVRTVLRNLLSCHQLLLALELVRRGVRPLPCRLPGSLLPRR